MSAKPLFSKDFRLLRVKRLTCCAAHFVAEIPFWSTNAKTGVSFNGNRGVCAFFPLKDRASVK